MKEKGTLEGYPLAEETNTENPKSFMEKKCDFLVPAAVEKSIH
jgi:glutamate dehydrogenase/leucine dehydrogenase